METNQATGSKLEPFNIGNTVVVEVKITEGETERVQAFRGIVIRKRGSGDNATFTVRRISRGEGVERIFPLRSPRIQSIRVVRDASSSKAKLYHLRKRSKRKK